MTAARILIIEDDPSILQGLELALAGAGYAVGTAPDGVAGLALARDERWDLIVLDIMLPGHNGYEILASLRSSGDETPVLVLTARSAELDTIRGLDLGADDYVTKPFALGELLARIRALLRRRAASSSVLEAGPLRIDTAACTVTRDGTAIELTASEYRVLLLLVRARGRVLSRTQILEAIHGPGHHGTPRAVDNFIAQLRNKLETDPSAPRLIRTVRGFGYRIAVS